MKTTLMLLSLALTATCLLNSCQSMNSAMTSSARVTSDDFDGSKVVRQESLSSSSSITEDGHMLGFDWNSRTPEKVFLTAGVHRFDNIFDLDFNVGGRIISAEPASLTTEHGIWSTRRFVVSYRDFEAIATSPLVKMKASGANSYSVSSFGTSTSSAVGSKFPKFLEQVRASR